MESRIGKQILEETLGISGATLNKWIKTRLIPPPDHNDSYTEAVFDSIISTIKNDPLKLNRRANRSQSAETRITYLGIKDVKRKELLKNIITAFKNSKLSVDEGVLALSISLFRSNGIISPADSETGRFLSAWLETCKNRPEVFEFAANYTIPNQDDDILGAFYQSLQSTAQKSRSGSYYTPAELLENIKIPRDKTVLDPCCGSGGILLKIISREHDPIKIYARDTDETALKICRVNLTLFFNDINISPNIEKQDITLFEKSDNKFDYIVTNPPWGSKVSKNMKHEFLKMYPRLQSTETFSIALYNCLNMTQRSGEIYFFLPHAFLNVAGHRNIRKTMLESGSDISIKLLGNAFKGVLSEGILLHIKKSGDTEKIRIENQNNDLHFTERNNIKPPDFIIPAGINDKDLALLDKIYALPHSTLEDKALFALGIVIGNNNKHLLMEQTIGSEAIYRGKDIQPYCLSAPSRFIELRPENYQQIAPLELYRREKIIYRFIGSRIVCALDKNGALILNSANMFIPGLYPMESIVCLFNSTVYAFIYRKKFRSKKILKSHLQSLPLPVLSGAEHQFFFGIHEQIIQADSESVLALRKKVDSRIYKIFGLDEGEAKYISLNA